MSIRKFGALLMLLALNQCSNYDLLDRLETPGSVAGGKETFTSNYYVFVSSWTTLGHMGGSPYSDCNGIGGPGGADCACTRAAIARGLRRSGSHVFRAWLSTSAADAKCRVQAQGNGCATSTPGPWFNTVGQAVFNDFNGLATATINVALRHDEFGLDQGPNLVWTATGASGTYASNDCSGWSNMTSGFFGTIGDRTATGNAWTQSTPDQACNTSQRIYCVASPVF